MAFFSTLELYVGEHAPTATISSCSSILVTLPWKPWELEVLEFVHKINGVLYITIKLPTEGVSGRFYAGFTFILHAFDLDIPRHYPPSIRDIDFSFSSAPLFISLHLFLSLSMSPIWHFYVWLTPRTWECFTYSTLDAVNLCFGFF